MLSLSGYDLILTQYTVMWYAVITVLNIFSVYIRFASFVNDH